MKTFLIMLAGLLLGGCGVNMNVETKEVASGPKDVVVVFTGDSIPRIEIPVPTQTILDMVNGSIENFAVKTEGKYIKSVKLSVIEREGSTALRIEASVLVYSATINVTQDFDLTLLLMNLKE